MSNEGKYLYSILHPNHALVASMLPPEEFGKHYTIGSSRYYHGVVIFAQIQTDYRNEWFPIEQYLDELKVKPDGSPKRSKFIKSYRVLEHLDLSAFQNLYVTSAEGEVLELEKQPYEKDHESGWIRTFQEICPLKMIVLTYMTPQEFGEYITTPDAPKSAPKVLFTQIDFNTKEFLMAIREDPFASSPITVVHPHKLRDQIEDLMRNDQKKVKGISLESSLNAQTILRLRTGYWLAAGKELLFYPIPSHEELERDHYRWFKSLHHV